MTVKEFMAVHDKTKDINWQAEFGNTDVKLNRFLAAQSPPLKYLSRTDDSASRQTYYFPGHNYDAKNKNVHIIIMPL